jgi:hypothetical protein
LILLAVAVQSNTNENTNNKHQGKKQWKKRVVIFWAIFQGGL